MENKDDPKRDLSQDKLDQVNGGFYLSSQCQNYIPGNGGKCFCSNYTGTDPLGINCPNFLPYL